MRYWQDFNDKYGFGDGGSTPPDAEACREAYIKVINGLAEKRGSKVRVVAYDRPGVHNGILVLMIPAKRLKGIPLHKGRYPLTDSFDKAVGKGNDEAKTDDIMDEIIDDLESFGTADEAVVVSANVDDKVISDIISKG
jgi:hypothetical protein